MLSLFLSHSHRGAGIDSLISSQISVPTVARSTQGKLFYQLSATQTRSNRPSSAGTQESMTCLQSTTGVSTIIDGSGYLTA